MQKGQARQSGAASEAWVQIPVQPSSALCVRQTTAARRPSYLLWDMRDALLPCGPELRTRALLTAGAGKQALTVNIHVCSSSSPSQRRRAAGRSDGMLALTLRWNPVVTSQDIEFRVMSDKSYSLPYKGPSIPNYSCPVL